MIPVFDLTRQNKILKKELDRAISLVIDRGVFILGPKVEEFEEQFAKYIGVKYAVGVASGTDAISLALLSVGIKPGDEVILPANSYPTAFAVTAIGAIPKLVDIDLTTFNIDPQKIPQVISKKTKAIIVVHLYGQPADLTPINRFIGVSGRKIYVIEDCAQAIGSSIKYHVSSITYENKKENKILNTKYIIRYTGEQKVGSIGDVGCFSFYPTKNLGCFGDGGMVVTNNEEIVKKVRLLRMYGEKRRYNSVLLGRNSRLDELQAAILLVKLKYLDKWNRRRREIADLYQSLVPPPGRSPSATFQVSLRPIASSLLLPAIILPYEVPDVKHVYHLFVIRTKKRNELKKYLEEREIQTAIHYPVPIHLVPSMKFLGYKKGDFPESEKACKEILSLPMFPELAEKEISQISQTISQFLFI